MSEDILVFSPPVPEEMLMPMVSAGMGTISACLKEWGYEHDQESLMVEARYRNQYKYKEDYYDLDVFERERVIEYLRGAEDEEISREANKLADHLEIDKYDVILASTKSEFCLLTGLPILKERAKDKLTVIGGAMSLTKDFSIAKLPFIDYAVNGDGEIPLQNILNHELKGEPLENDTGLYHGDEEEFVEGDYYQHPMDMKPAPVFEDHIIERLKDIYPTDEFIFPYQFGRGCTQNCSFCNYFENREYQYKSIEKTVKELKEIEERRPKANIFFTDSNLFNDPDYIAEFAEKMKESSCSIDWGSQAIILPRKQEFFDKLSDGGCKALFHGIESVSNTVLHRMRKAQTREMVESTLKKEYNAGINTMGFFIVNFVGETKEEYFETIDFFKKNRHLQQASAGYLRTKMDGRTPLYTDKEDFGIEFEDEKEPEDYIEETLMTENVDYKGNKPEQFASKEEKGRYARKVARWHLYNRNFAREHPVTFIKKTIRNRFKKDYKEYDWIYA